VPHESTWLLYCLSVYLDILFYPPVLDPAVVLSFLPLIEQKELKAFPVEIFIFPLHNPSRFEHGGCYLGLSRVIFTLIHGKMIIIWTETHRNPTLTSKQRSICNKHHHVQLNWAVWKERSFSLFWNKTERNICSPPSFHTVEYEQHFSTCWLLQKQCRGAWLHLFKHIIFTTIFC